MNIYFKASKKYRPNKIKVLFIAESPPAYKDKSKMSYFYFENNPGGDILFATLIKAIYGENYRKNENLKRDLLERLKKNGYFLKDAVTKPINTDKKGRKRTDKERETIIEEERNKLLKELKIMFKRGFITSDTKLILIKETVYNKLREFLDSKGFNVINRKYIGFPRYYGDRDIVKETQYLINI
jgi:hypothetical protein